MARVARGLLARDPRYLAELRARLGERPVRDLLDRAPCKVCGSRRVAVKTLKGLPVRRCRACGFVGNPGNFKDYSAYTSLTKLALTPRVGTPERPGREFQMAQLAAGERTDLSVLVYGPGRSVDYRWIAGLPGVRHVAIGDLMKLVDDAPWVDLSADVAERFDLVVACEVIEHFTDPVADFAQLFAYVADDGVAVCSTNVFDGGRLDRHGYLFIGGHTSYYSPASLVRLARSQGMFVDFRAPCIEGVSYRKRYVVFARSVERLTEVAVYFGDHVYAPAEH